MWLWVWFWDHVLLCRGVWNVPFVNQALLLSGQWLRRTAHELPSWESEVLDSDMAFAAWMRERVYTTHSHWLWQCLLSSLLGTLHVCQQSP